MVANQEYVKTISDIRYNLKIDDMMRPKAKVENDI